VTAYWESSNLLLPISFQGKAVFTQRDWLLLFGNPRENAGSDIDSPTPGALKVMAQ
jgi:Superinfection immunity protein